MAEAQGCGFFWQSSNPSTTPNSIRSVAWNGSIYVAVGDIDTVLTSADGATWTRRPVPDAVTNGLTAVAWGAGRFVATLGNLNDTLTSLDGITWTLNATSLPYPATPYCLLYTGGAFVCAGYNQIYTSVDGLTWQFDTSFPSDINGLAFGGGTYVVVLSSGAIFSSPDGKSWTQRQSWTTTAFYAVAYGGGEFVAVGYGGRLLTSYDGANWFVRPSPTMNDLKSVVYGGGQFLAWNSLGQELVSTNGLTWTLPGSSFQIPIYQVIYDGSSFMAVGAGGAVYTSSTGTAWTMQSINVSAANFAAVTYDAHNSIFVAVGQGGAILTSPDGVTWTLQSSPTTDSLQGVTSGGGTIVAVGDGGTAVSSTDGLVWTGCTMGTNLYFASVSYGAGTFVAVGSSYYSGDTPVYTSTDGATWNPETFVPSVTSLTDVAYGLSQFIAVSLQRRCLRQPRRRIWAQTFDGPYGLSGIVFGDGLFVVANTYWDGTWLLSTDGLLWNEYNPFPNNYYYQLGKLSYYNGQFQTPAQTQIALSQNGVDWGVLQTGSSKALYAMATDGTTTVAVGTRGDDPEERVHAHRLFPLAFGGPPRGRHDRPHLRRGPDGTTQVLFGDVQATSFTVNSGGLITAVSPAHAAATMDVKVTAPGGTSPETSADQFTWLGPPIINQLSPNGASLAGGTQIEIYGSNFCQGSTVTFGASPRRR